jgi:hypothetical protein
MRNKITPEASIARAIYLPLEAVLRMIQALRAGTQEARYYG